MMETGTVQGLFHRLVRTAMRSQNVRTSENTEHYLVQLLIAFVRPRRQDLLDAPLGMEFVAALQAPGRQGYDRLRDVADTALFFTGLFVEYLERTLVGPAYYMQLGRSAYARLSVTREAAPLAPAFEEIAERFPDVVRVLSEISQRDICPRDADLLRVYKRWLLTRSGHDAAVLVRHGAIPWAPSGNVRH